MLPAHEMRRSPMSLAVPLEGTDSLPGLRALESDLLKERLLSNPQASTSRSRQQACTTAPFKHCQQAEQLYEGPYLTQLSQDDWKAEPKRWSLFFVNGEKGPLRQAYSVPRSVAALNARVEENLVYYLPNYLRVLVVGLILQFYLQPKALLAALLLLTTVLTNWWVSGAPPSTQASLVTSALPFLYVLAGIIAYQLRCFLVVVRWSTSCMSFIFLHSTLRKAQSEHKRQARQDALHRTPLRLFGRSRKQGNQAQEDRWSLFHELAAITKHNMRALAVAAYVAVHERVTTLVDKWVYFSQWATWRTSRRRNKPIMAAKVSVAEPDKGPTTGSGTVAGCGIGGSGALAARVGGPRGPAARLSWLGGLLSGAAGPSRPTVPSWSASAMMARPAPAVT